MGRDEGQTGAFLLGGERETFKIKAQDIFQMSLKPSGATENDVAGQIRPAGLVFDTCVLTIRSSPNNRIIK